MHSYMEPACLGTVGGCNTLLNSTQKGPTQDLNQEPSWFEVTVLISSLPKHLLSAEVAKVKILLSRNADTSAENSSVKAEVLNQLL